MTITRALFCTTRMNSDKYLIGMPKTKISGSFLPPSLDDEPPTSGFTGSEVIVPTTLRSASSTLLSPIPVVGEPRRDVEKKVTATRVPVFLFCVWLHSSNGLLQKRCAGKLCQQGRHAAQPQGPAQLWQAHERGQAIEEVRALPLPSTNLGLENSANYVREEMPVRLAHRINAFQQLPFVVGSNKSINQVYELYWEAFEAFRKVTEITTLEVNKTVAVIMLYKVAL